MVTYTQKVLGDLLYEYAKSKVYEYKNPKGKYYKSSNKAGGQSKPYRVNERSSAWTKGFRGSNCGADCSKLATRGYVKNALQIQNIGKEVTANSANILCGSLVDYRLGKNIDKGTDSGDRQRGTITLIGFRFFGSLTLNSTGPSPTRFRFLIVRDKTPGRPIREALFSTITDSRQPVDFVTGTTTQPINAVRPINPDRFVVMHDWVERLSLDNAQEPNYGRSIVFNRYFKINKKLSYNAGYLTDDKQLTPALHLLYFPVADNGNASTSVDTNFQFEEFFSD